MFVKSVLMTIVVFQDKYTKHIIQEQLGLRKLKKVEVKKDMNLFKFFQASLTIEIIYTILNAVTEQLNHPEKNMVVCGNDNTLNQKRIDDCPDVKDPAK